jgi:hypothetical protein
MTVNTFRPRFGSIPGGMRYASIGRTKLYAAAAKRPELFRKWDGKTLVDFDVLDEIMNDLPIAKIKPAADHEDHAA